MRHRSVLPAVAAAFVTTVLTAGEGRADPLRHTGFMARLGLGVGYLGSTETLPIIGDLTVSGVSGSTNIAIGGYLTPGFALHATIWGGTAFGPSVSAGGVTTDTSTDASLRAAAFGVGGTWFLSPVDVYFSGSLGVGVLSAARTRGSTTTTSSTGSGFAFNLAVGKQFALSPDWGLGVSGQFGWQSNPDDYGSGSYTITTLQAAVLASLTYH